MKNDNTNLASRQKNRASKNKSPVWRIGLTFLGVLLVVSLAVNGYFIHNKIQAEQAAKHVYSHRGASGEEVEHTFSAYDLAIQYGSNYIEQDLVTSKDGTLYVSHDLSAKKITGVDKLYADLTDQEIDALKTTSGEAILTLQSVFDRYGEQVNYVIELKENDQQTALFQEIVAKNNLKDKIIVQSSSHEPLDKLEEVYPEMPKLLLVKKQEELTAALANKNVDIISVNKSLMNEENVKLVHDKHKMFNAWTLDTTNEIKSAITLGVDTYFTDFTAKALSLEAQFRK